MSDKCKKCDFATAEGSRHCCVKCKRGAGHGKNCSQQPHRHSNFRIANCVNSTTALVDQIVWPRDWSGTQLQQYVHPPKPAENEGTGALEQLARNPHDKPGRVLLATQHCVVAYDVFPKGRVHLLILPREELSGPSDLRVEHEPLVRHMVQLAQWVARQLRHQIAGLAPLRCGFHAVPNMKRLHLHLVSIDHDTVQLKRKRHWISFNTDFLVPPLQWAAQLAQHGRIMVNRADEEAKLKGEIHCPRSERVLKSMDELKLHLHSREYEALVEHISADLIFIDGSQAESSEPRTQGQGQECDSGFTNPPELVKVAWDMVRHSHFYGACLCGGG